MVNDEALALSNRPDHPHRCSCHRPASAAEQRAGLIRDLEAENEYLTRRLDQSRDQLRQMTERIVELEANRALDQALKGTGLAGQGQAFLAAEQEHGVDAVTLAAICAHESGWGTSKLARERNNLAGLGAYSAGLGMTFESRADCVDYLARLLAGRPGSLTVVGAWNAEVPGWARKVAGCVRVITGRAAHVIH